LGGKHKRHSQVCLLILFIFFTSLSPALTSQYVHLDSSNTKNKRKNLTWSEVSYCEHTATRWNQKFDSWFVEVLMSILHICETYEVTIYATVDNDWFMIHYLDQMVLLGGWWMVYCWSWSWVLCPETWCSSDLPVACKKTVSAICGFVCWALGQNMGVIMTERH